MENQKDVWESKAIYMQINFLLEDVVNKEKPNCVPLIDQP